MTTKRQRSSSIVVCERPRKKKCRRVQFRNDVKKHDGLKPQTKIFEEVRFSNFFRFCVEVFNDSTLQTVNSSIHDKW